MSLASGVSTLATRIANYLRDSVVPRLIPSGGSVGQVLTKTGSGDYQFAWGGTATFTALSVTGSVSFATLTVAARPTWAGLTPWDSGNFDPTAKANLAGATFTGAIGGTNATFSGTAQGAGLVATQAGDATLTLEDTSAPTSSYRQKRIYSSANVAGGSNWLFRQFRPSDGAYEDWQLASGSGGTIWTSGNLTPANKLDKTGDGSSLTFVPSGAPSGFSPVTIGGLPMFGLAGFNTYQPAPAAASLLWSDFGATGVASSNSRAYRVLHAAMPGPHTGYAQSKMHIGGPVVGSGVNGPTAMDGGLTIKHYKQNYGSSTARGQGEIDGIYVAIFQDGARTGQEADRSDCSVMLGDIRTVQGVGYAAFLEGVTYQVDQTNFAPQLCVSTQVGVVDSILNQQVGFQATASMGSITAGLSLGHSAYGSFYNFVTLIEPNRTLLTISKRCSITLDIPASEGASAPWTLRNNGGLVSFVNGAGSIETLSISQAGAVTAAGGVTAASFTTTGFAKTGAISATGSISASGNITGSGSLSVTGPIIASGLAVRRGTGGTSGGSQANFFLKGSNLELWIDNTLVANIPATFPTAPA